MSEDKKYKVIIKSYNITDGTVIERNDKSRIVLENIGTTNALINNIIPLNAGNSRRFIEHHESRIDTDFEVVFPGGQNAGNNILIIESYYEKIA